MKATTNLFTVDDIGNEILNSNIGYYEFIIKNFYRIDCNLGSLESVIMLVRFWFESHIIEEIQDVGLVKILPRDGVIAYSEKEEYKGKFFNLDILERLHPCPWTIPAISFYASKSENILIGRTMNGTYYLHSEVIEKYMDFIQNDPEAKNNAMSFFENLKKQSNAK